MGRYLVATKNIDEGELILNESPMVVGPRQLTKPVCLGCHKEITPTTPFIKYYQKCLYSLFYQSIFLLGAAGAIGQYVVRDVKTVHSMMRNVEQQKLQVAESRLNTLAKST